MISYADIPLRRWAIALSSVLVASAVGWLLTPSLAPRQPAREPTVRTPEPAAAPRVALAVPPAADATPVDFTPQGLAIRPAGSAAVDAQGMVPHPLTPQHQRIFRENILIHDLNGAMDLEDGAALRRLLKQYRDEYPEDAHVLQDGYELIADCLQRPGIEARAAAQRYYDEQLDSGVRRYIRRHCLEASHP